MATDVEICRMALLHCGNDTIIQSLDADEKIARLCKTFYESTKKAYLREFNWNFSTSTKALALYGVAPSAWTYQYKYPNNCLFARNIVSANSAVTIPFIIRNDEGTKVILCNEANAELDYTVDITEASLFDDLFVEAFALRLAIALCTPLSSSQSRLDTLTKAFNIANFKAQTADGNEGQAEEPRPATWHEAR